VEPVTDSPRRRIKLIVQYDGTDYHGWQRQDGDITVQQVMEEALARLLDHPVTLISAGRTDAGVHAAGQAAHFDTTHTTMTARQIMLGGNRFLPPDIRILDAERADPTFHARFSAVSRRYRYVLRARYLPLERRYSWYPRLKWDDDLVCRIVPSLHGIHSFKSFSLARPDETEYRCNILAADWIPTDGGAVFDITADRFFHKMVRGLVTTLVRVGAGRTSPEEFDRLLNTPKRNGAVGVAPPQGLTLIEVKY